jgi:hypothetical protein
MRDLVRDVHVQARRNQMPAGSGHVERMIYTGGSTVKLESRVTNHLVFSNPCPKYECICPKEQ